jgi:polar amino acid transport system ATP-binding protein
VTELLRLDGVRKSFGEHVVLREVDLTIEPGECVVLIGASGSGKSTLLRCVNLLEVVDDGVISFEGRDITDPRVDGDEVRSRMGLVFQAYNLFPHLDVMGNVTLALRLVHGVGAEEARSRGMAMLERVGLAAKAEARPDDLSGGQQQRVAIARALVANPRLMLLDEVTSALDPELVGEVLDLLTELKAEGVTMLLNTHEMGFARDVASEVVFLHQGRIEAQGPPGAMFGSPPSDRFRQFLAGSRREAAATAEVAAAPEPA